MTDLPTPAPVPSSGASIRRTLVLAAEAAEVWDAIADFAAVHRRVAPGFVVDLRMEGAARVVTFASGAVATEVLVDRDAATRRLVYAIPDGPFASYSASLQVFEEGPRTCRLVWIVDLLPAAMGAHIAGSMDIAVPIMKATLEGRPDR